MLTCLKEFYHIGKRTEFTEVNSKVFGSFVTTILWSLRKSQAELQHESRCSKSHSPVPLLTPAPWESSHNRRTPPCPLPPAVLTTGSKGTVT